MGGSVSGLSVLFHESTCQFSCLDHIVLIIGGLESRPYESSEVLPLENCFVYSRERFGDFHMQDCRSPPPHPTSSCPQGVKDLRVPGAMLNTPRCTPM